MEFIQNPHIFISTQNGSDCPFRSMYYCTKFEKYCDGTGDKAYCFKTNNILELYYDVLINGVE